MATKSRYQLINRGRKGKPCWTIEDFDGLEPGDAVGKYLTSSRTKCNVEGQLHQWRSEERKQAAENKKGQQ